MNVSSPLNAPTPGTWRAPHKRSAQTFDLAEIQAQERARVEARRAEKAKRRKRGKQQKIARKRNR